MEEKSSILEQQLENYGNLARPSQDYNPRIHFPRIIQESQKFFEENSRNSLYLVLDGEKIIRGYSESQPKLLGYEQEELLGNPLDSVLLCEEDEKIFQEAIAKSKHGSLKHTKGVKFTWSYIAGFKFGAGILKSINEKEALYTHYRLTANILRNKEKPRNIELITLNLKKESHDWCDTKGEFFSLKNYLCNCSIDKALRKLNDIRDKVEKGALYTIKIESEKELEPRLFCEIGNLLRIEGEKMGKVKAIGVKDLPDRYYTSLRNPDEFNIPRERLGLDKLTFMTQEK